MLTSIAVASRLLSPRYLLTAADAAAAAAAAAATAAAAVPAPAPSPAPASFSFYSTFLVRSDLQKFWLAGRKQSARIRKNTRSDTRTEEPRLSPPGSAETQV